ncbi:MAG: sialidase family protein [Verrucomicrobiota bacterium]
MINRNFFQCACLILLAGCSSFDRATHSDSRKIIETMLAPATATHPRQSEGDILVLKDGFLLAAWTDFSGGGHDHSSAVISAAKSKDGGRTWSAPFVFQENIGKQNVMSVSFLRARSGEILFFFLEKNSATNLKVVMRRSRDEARTWSQPMIITPGPGYHIMNNARVIQLKTGRILCPISFGEDISKREWNLRNFIYFSDDNGRNWQRSKDIVECAKRGAMEPGLIELKNGNVLQIIRTELGQIYFSLSKDGGNTWSKATPYGIVSPESPSTIARMPNGELLLIYNPILGANHMTARTPLVAALSRDEGRTWSKPKVIEASADVTYAYTSVTFHRDRALLTYYFAPNGTKQLSLKFKSIPVEWFREE